MTIDNQPISLFFHNGAIALAFAELLNAMGYETEQLQSEDELRENQKLITEPLFYKTLSEGQKENCLVIGDRYSKNSVKCPYICQPLTPEKVERGLSEFLEISSSS